MCAAPATPRASDFSRDTQPVSSANLDLVRSIYAGWEHGDFSSSAWADRDIEFAFAGGPDPGEWSGVTEMAEGWRDWLGAWEGFCAQPEEYLVPDSGRVLVLVRNIGRGRTSGVQLKAQSVANLFEIRDGKVVRLVIYFDRGRALADVGLSNADSPDL
jgi:ketosteroid isomerase-like protein